MKVMPFTVPGLFNKTHFGRTGALNTHLLHFLCLIDDGYRKNGASGPFGYSYPIPVIVLYFFPFASSQTFKTNTNFGTVRF